MGVLTHAPNHRLIRPLLLLGALVCWLAFAGAAHAASLSLSHSADPTEDKTVNVTATGDAGTGNELYVFVQKGGTLCASTAQGQQVAGSYEITPSYGAYHSGAFTDSRGYLPATADSYRVCGYIASSYASTPTATATDTFTARTPTADLTISHSLDPTEDKSMSVSATGNTEVARELYMFIARDASDCATTAQAERGVAYELTPSYGSYKSSGNFTDTESYLPSEPGTYRVCAYIAETYAAAPNSLETTTLTVRRPNAAITLSHSDDPAESRPITISASGSTEAARELYVFLAKGATSCAGSAQGERGVASEVTPSYGYYVLGGSYSHSESYTVGEPGSYRVCAYMAETYAAEPNAVAEQAIEVRAAGGALNLAYSGDGVVGHAGTLTLGGTTEADRELYLYVLRAASACPATASMAAATPNSSELSGTYGSGWYVSAGTLPAKSASFTPGQPAAYRACAYLAKALGAVPNAQAELPINAQIDPAIVPVETWPQDGATTAVQNQRFNWKGGPGKDVLMIYGADPASGAQPIAKVAVKGTYNQARFDAAKDAAGNWSVSVLDAFRPGTYWWAVERTYDNGLKAGTRAARFVIAAPVLSHLVLTRRLRLLPRFRLPGATSLLLRAVPFGHVTFRLVRTACRVVRSSVHAAGSCGSSTRHYALDQTGRKTLRFNWSCARAGAYRYTVEASDDLGHVKRASGRWQVSAARCVRIRNAERLARQRAAERKRAAARRRAAQRNSSGGGSGGSNGDGGGGSSGGGGGGCDGDPNATPYPQYVGQRDADHDGCYGET